MGIHEVIRMLSNALHNGAISFRLLTFEEPCTAKQNMNLYDFGYLNMFKSERNL